MDKRLTFTLLAVVIVAFVTITINNAPTKIIHPDALRFMSIFQQQYETVSSASDVPRAIYNGIKEANKYDWYRGRLTNYAAFGMEALIRSYLPFPFISWLTMAILIFNAALLTQLITKGLTSTYGRHLLFGLAILALLINPIFIASYEMQFIYSKYLCITFVLLFMLSKSKTGSTLALIGAMFSDEIGVAFTMIAAFLVVFNFKIKKFNDNEQLVLSSIGRPIILGAFAAGSALLLYFAILYLLFGHVSMVILHGGFHSNYKLPPTILEFLIELLSSSTNAFFLSFGLLNDIVIATIGYAGIAILLLSAGVGSYKNIKTSDMLSLPARLRTLPLRSYLVDKRIQVMAVAVFMIMFISCAMYRGKASLFYYAYPVYMLIMFVIVSFLVKICSERWAAIALMILAISLALNLPSDFARIRNEVSSNWIVGNSISIESFDLVETAIDEVKQKNCTSVVNVAINAQDNVFGGVSNTFGTEYFPVVGIVNVLAWPHKFNHCPAP